MSSRFVAVGEVAVGESPVTLVRGQSPGLVGSDGLRDPLVQLREGMRLQNGAGGSPFGGADRVNVYTGRRWGPLPATRRR